MTKKPSNRFSIPKVIISDVDSSNILEFKVKFEKLGRVDKFIVNKMHYNSSNEVIFDKVECSSENTLVKLLKNNQKIEIEIQNKKFYITGKKVGGKKRLLEDKVSKAKVQLTLSNASLDKKTINEKELLNTSSKNLFNAITNRDIKSTTEIYLAKRFLSYRSNLLLYFGLVDNFFKVANNYKELHKIDFNKNPELIKYFIYTINDKLKNSKGYLHNYCKDNNKIISDLNKIKNNFEKLRHALMHFDYDFFENLFGGKNSELNFDIEFLNIMLKKIDNLNIDTKKEYINSQEITIFKEKIKLSKLYDIYEHTNINRLGFNALINSFIIKDGVENSTLKEYFNSKSKDTIVYYIDIHQNPKYKKLYIEHKVLVSKTSAQTDGKIIAQNNKKISDLKNRMKEITDTNSLNRLEYKLRLAFGFIYSNYSNYKHFKKSFDTDLKSGKFKNLKTKDYINYYESTFMPNSKEKNIEELSKYIDKLSLYSLVKDDSLLKFIILMFIFIPKELKGDFLGFVKKYYHDITNINNDSKDRDLEYQDDLPTLLKLKILSKNIRSLSLLKHSLSLKAKYSKEFGFYEDGNINRKFYKKLGISHNQEEFDKTIYAPLFKYHSILYKLINDFEIYTLYKNIDSSKSLSQVIQKDEFKNKNYFNFRKLLNKTYNNNSYEKMIQVRNEISHLTYEALFDCPLNNKKSYKFNNRTRYVDSLPITRDKIINAILKNSDIVTTLGYNPINDFTMKVIQLRKKLETYSNKSKQIDNLLQEAKTPNDYYNIYKIKAIESINRELLNIIGVTKTEKEIEQKISIGNKNISKP